MVKHLCLCMIVACMACTATARDITGQWIGKLQVPGGRLTLILHLSNDGDGRLSASLDSPDQGATGIPCDSVVYAEPNLTVVINAIGGRYEATLDGDTLRGLFTQFGRSYPLLLTTTAEEDRSSTRPQEPKKPYPYLAEDVRFVNATDGDTFAGTLTLPMSPGPHKAVVMITGSGAQYRDETVMGHKPFLVWADALTKRGIAVLRYDDRGLGASTGNFDTATMADFSRDAEAAVDYLRSRKEIDSRRIGLIGHSEGGMVAPRVAVSRPKDVAFIVLLAAPGLRGDSLLLLQDEAVARRSGLPDSVREANLRLNRSLFALLLPETADEEILRQTIADTLRSAYFDGPLALPMPHEHIERTIMMAMDMLTSPWMRDFLRYDPLPTLSQVQCPVLAIQGSEDVQVPAEENLPRIRRALEHRGDKGIAVREFPGLNHLFQHCETGLPNEYGQIRETVAPEVVQFVGDWMVAQ